MIDKSPLDLLRAKTYQKTHSSLAQKINNIQKYNDKTSDIITIKKIIQTPKNNTSSSEPTIIIPSNKNKIIIGQNQIGRSKPVFYPRVNKQLLINLKTKINNRCNQQLIQTQTLLENPNQELLLSDHFFDNCSQPIEPERNLTNLTLRSQHNNNILNQDSLNLSSQVIYEQESTQLNSTGTIYKKLNRLPTNNQVRILALFSVMIFLISASIWSYSIIENNQKLANASKEPISAFEIKKNTYKLWVEAINNGIYSPPELDLDVDGLTNYEEFLIGSNPLKASSCNAKITDIQNLINLINPATCKVIDLTNPEEINKFGEVITIPQIDIEITQEPNSKPIIKDNLDPKAKNLIK